MLLNDRENIASHIITLNSGYIFYHLNPSYSIPAHFVDHAVLTDYIHFRLGALIR